MIKRCPIVNILIRSRDIRDRSPELFEIALNFARFWLPFFRRGEEVDVPKVGGSPNFWGVHYLSLHISDYAAELCGDRPTELSLNALRHDGPRRITRKALRILKLESFREPTVKIP